MASTLLNESKSLWNVSLSPGWTPREVEVFRLALMKYGLGRWTIIVERGVLPGKTVGQMNNQMQRMIGQQSTGEFQGLHIDPSVVFAHNATRTGVRKNGVLINTGENPTPEKIRQKRLANQERWGMSQAEIDAVEIPTLVVEETSGLTEATTRAEKLARLRALQDELDALQKRARASPPTVASAAAPAPGASDAAPPVADAAPPVADADAVAVAVAATYSAAPLRPQVTVSAPVAVPVAP